MATPTTSNTVEDTKGTVQYAEEPAAPPNKRSRFLAHLKRFWWAYLLLAVCLVALLVPILIFVGIKNLAQSKLSNAKLEIQGIIVTNAKVDSFNMAINSTIKGDKTKATVKPFNGSMYLEDEPSHTPFATILFPETKNQPMQAVNISQQIDIVNKDALITFNTWLLLNESLRVTVEGHTHIKVPGISHLYPVHFKKTLTLTGMNSFAGISVADITLNATNFADGTNFHATTTIPNRSIVSFEIGNTTFNTFLQGKAVGTSYIDNVFLSPGDNVYAYRAEIDALTVLSAMNAQPYCGNGTLPFDISGKSVSNHGEDLVYFSDALAARNDTIQVPLSDPFKAIGFKTGCSS